MCTSFVMSPPPLEATPRVGTDRPALLVFLIRPAQSSKDGRRTDPEGARTSPRRAQIIHTYPFHPPLVGRPEKAYKYHQQTHPTGVHDHQEANG